MRAHEAKVGGGSAPAAAGEARVGGKSAPAAEGEAGAGGARATTAVQEGGVQGWGACEAEETRGRRRAEMGNGWLCFHGYCSDFRGVRSEQLSTENC